ncbi:hypothetical protein EAL2_c16200 [Peptoclostridium acidaminophilum DSM 3953]|uniref:Uncharacterized protein n=1 Tax=Peptoclostridium acidaminophilum DSM 3953 TaxID=1286171 RepID=W8T7N8_PEPAC|nr:hypothetical protein [Peptoclostridium acidaminophilum]AHM56915.1 hypothetical protein EAL2_c16200 [Peptoclostridium acidaminophilum DSM 3953]
MFLLFQGINIIIATVMLAIPVAACIYVIKRLSIKTSQNDDFSGRVAALEKKVEELEDYINNSFR